MRAPELEDELAAPAAPAAPPASSSRDDGQAFVFGPNRDLPIDVAVLGAMNEVNARHDRFAGSHGDDGRRAADCTDPAERAVREELEAQRKAEAEAFRAFDLGAFFREVAAREARRTPEERAERARERREQLRRRARGQIGPLAPEWLERKVASDPSFLTSPKGAQVARFARVAFGEEREAALRDLASLLVERGVPGGLVLLLVESWACRFCAPAVHEDELVAVVASAKRKR